MMRWNDMIQRTSEPYVCLLLNRIDITRDILSNQTQTIKSLATSRGLP